MIHPLFLRWIANYLYGRSHAVCLCGKLLVGLAICPVWCTSEFGAGAYFVLHLLHQRYYECSVIMAGTMTVTLCWRHNVLSHYIYVLLLTTILYKLILIACALGLTAIFSLLLPPTVSTLERCNILTLAHMQRRQFMKLCFVYQGCQPNCCVPERSYWERNPAQEPEKLEFPCSRGLYVTLVLTSSHFFPSIHIYGTN